MYQYVVVVYSESSNDWTVLALVHVTVSRDTQDDPSCSMYKIKVTMGEEREGGETRAEGGGQE